MLQELARRSCLAHQVLLNIINLPVDRIIEHRLLRGHQNFVQIHGCRLQSYRAEIEMPVQRIDFKEGRRFVLIPDQTE